MSTSEDETQREDAKGSPEADTNTDTTSIQTVGNVENEPSRSSDQIAEKETPESSCEVKQLKNAKNIEAEMEIVEHQSLNESPSVSESNIPSSNENDHDSNEGVSFCQINNENSEIKSSDIERMNPSSDDSEAVLKRKIVTISPKAGETYQKRTRKTESEEDLDCATTVPDTIESRQTQNVPVIVIEEVGIATTSTQFEFSSNVEIRLQTCSDSDTSPDDCKHRLVESDSDDNSTVSGVVKTELFIPEIDRRDIAQVEVVIIPCMSNSSTNTSLTSYDENRDSGIQSSSMSTLDMYEPDMDDSIISSGDTVMTALSTESIPEPSSGVHSGESLHSSVSDLSCSLDVKAVNPAENPKISVENTAEVEKQCPVSDTSSCKQNDQEDLLENKSTDQYDVCTQNDKSSLTDKQQENDADIVSVTSGGLETMSAVGPRDDSPNDDSNMSLSLYSEHSSEYDQSSSTTTSNTDEIPPRSQHVKKGKTALSPLYAYTKGKKNVLEGSSAQQMEGSPAVQTLDVEDVESSPSLVIVTDSTVSTNREEKLSSSGNDDENVTGDVQDECYSLYSGNERGQELSPRDRYYKHWKVFADKQWNKGEEFNAAFERSIMKYEQQQSEPTLRNEPTGPIDCGQDPDKEEGVQGLIRRNDAVDPTDGEAVATGADIDKVACVPMSSAPNSEIDPSEGQGVAAAEDARMVSNLSDSGSSSEGDFLSPPRDARLLPLFVKMDEMKEGREEMAEDFDPYAQVSEIVSVPDDGPFRSKDLVKMGYMLDAFLSARGKESSSSEESSDHE